MLLSSVLLNGQRHEQIVSPCGTLQAGTIPEGLRPAGLAMEILPPAPEWSLLPGLEAYQGRRYHKSMTMAVRLLPCWHHEGFFIAKLKKR